jgi:toluene monooxygenase system ferredoxin subunit
MALRRVAALSALWKGDKMVVIVGGRRVLLVRPDDAVFAYEDRCAHLGVALSEGRLEGCVLTCAAHEWQYDAASGCGINPRTARLTRFAVVVQGDAIFVDVDAPGGGAPSTPEGGPENP